MLTLMKAAAPTKKFSQWERNKTPCSDPSACFNADLERWLPIRSLYTFSCSVQTNLQITESQLEKQIL